MNIGKRSPSVQDLRTEGLFSVHFLNGKIMHEMYKIRVLHS